MTQAPIKKTASPLDRAENVMRLIHLDTEICETDFNIAVGHITSAIESAEAEVEAAAIRRFALAAACPQHGAGSMAFHCSECGKAWQAASRQAAKEAAWVEGATFACHSKTTWSDKDNPYRQEASR